MSREEECKGCSKVWTFGDMTLEDIQKQESEESAYQPMIDSIVKEGLQHMDGVGQDAFMDTGDGEQAPKVLTQTTGDLRDQLKHEGVAKFLAPVNMVGEQD